MNTDASFYVAFFVIQIFLKFTKYIFRAGAKCKKYVSLYIIYTVGDIFKEQIKNVSPCFPTENRSGCGIEVDWIDWGLIELMIELLLEAGASLPSPVPELSELLCVVGMGWQKLPVLYYCICIILYLDINDPTATYRAETAVHRLVGAAGRLCKV